jgi:hypothetical protein
MKKLLVFAFIAVFSASVAAVAAEPDKAQVLETLQEFIDAQTIDGTFPLYDAVTDDLLRLKFKELHDATVRVNGGFIATCADFTDEAGTAYDIDFLVAEKDGGYRVLQSVVHSVDGEKRDYHLEDKM